MSTAALHLALRMGAEVHVTSRDPAKGEQALALGAVAAYDSAGDWKVKAHVVVESVGPATWDRSVRALEPGGRLVVCGGTSGQAVELNLPRLFFKQHEIIGSTMGSYGEFADGHRAHGARACRSPSTRSSPSTSTRRPSSAFEAATSSASSSCATRTATSLRGMDLTGAKERIRAEVEAGPTCCSTPRTRSTRTRS